MDAHGQEYDLRRARHGELKLFDYQCSGDLSTAYRTLIRIYQRLFKPSRTKDDLVSLKLPFPDCHALNG
jgi:hypothetical protein